MKTVPSASLFRNFRRILDLNNAVIEKIADLERALAGEYVFDRTFLQTTIRELHRLVREVIYNLNELSADRYLALYARFESIRSILQDLLAGGPGPYGGRLTLAYELLHRDLDHLAGTKNANLGEIRNSLGLRTPDGFAVTVAGYRHFMEENDLFTRIAALRARQTERRALPAAELRELFRQATVPRELREEIEQQLRELFSRRGGPCLLAVRSSAVGEDGSRSFAGQFRSVLQVGPGKVLDAYREVCATRFEEQVLDYLGPQADDRQVPVAVGIQEMIPGLISGVVYTLDPTAPEDPRLTISAVAGTGELLVGGKADPESYQLERHFPFSLLASRITAKPAARQLPDGKNPLDYDDSRFRRGSALLHGSQLSLLAEQSMFLEKAFGSIQDVEWTLAPDGGLVILQSRTLRLPRRPAPQAAQVAAELRQAVILMQDRGQVAHLGVAAGPVILIKPEAEAADFPVGGIAVCRYASPQLAGIVRKAAALITDIGSPTGHLATIAREYRTPALFGTGNATLTLPSGMPVTVDTEAKCVYEGVIAGLLALQSGEEEPYQQEPEMRTLRRLLRWVAPIHLPAPDHPGFRVESCRTYHDLIRFCHEKAVENLIQLHTSSASEFKAHSAELEAAFPLKLRVIDLDGGLAPHAPGAGIRLAAIRSRPLRALLKGLGSENAWSQEPVPFGLKDLFSSMTRPLAHPPQFSGENLALVAENYCNLTLRLGYHFNVIDSFISQDPDDNYIYFRFVGGMAEKSKRERRAILIGTILASLHFKVERQGDLLIGKAKMLAPEHMDAILTHLGKLIGFTRQLDVRMVDEESVELFYGRFLERSRTLIASRPETP